MPWKIDLTKYHLSKADRSLCHACGHKGYFLCHNEAIGPMFLCCAHCGYICSTKEGGGVVVVSPGDAAKQRPSYLRWRRLQASAKIV